MKKDFWKVEVLYFLGTKDWELVTNIRVLRTHSRTTWTMQQTDLSESYYALPCKSILDLVTRASSTHIISNALHITHILNGAVLTRNVIIIIIMISIEQIQYLFGQRPRILAISRDTKL